MRNLFTSLLLWVSITTIQAQDQRIIATNDMTAGEIIVKNAYIEFTQNDSIGLEFPFIVTDVGSLTWDTQIGEPTPNDIFRAFNRIDAFSKMRAARYRFHKTLTYDEKGHISSTAKTAEELNISDKVFKRFIKELESKNNSLERQKKERNSDKVIIHGDNDYLTQLLKEPKDFSNLEIKDNGLTARDIVEQNIFIPYTLEEINMKKYQNEYEATINYVHPAYRAAMYRFYTNVKQDKDGICTWTIQNGKELNMSEGLFQLFVEQTTSSNEFIKEKAQEGITATTTEYNEKFLNELLDDKHAKYLLEIRQNTNYMPRYNRIEIK